MTHNFSRLLRTVVACLLVATVVIGSLAGPLVSATPTNQVGGPQGTPPSTPSNSTNTTTTTSDGGGGGGGGLFNVDIPSFDPVKNLKKILRAMFGIPGWFVTTINNKIFGIPAPGKMSEPKTWISPSNGLWPGIKDFTAWSTAVASIILMISGSLSFLHGSTRARNEAWKRWGIAATMILVTWTALPLVLHMSNALVEVLRPSSTEAFSNWANIGKITGGLVMLLVFSWIQPAIVGIGVFVLAVEEFLIYAGFGLWPLAWALRSTRYGLARSLGETFVFLFGVAIATKIGQAFFARLLFSLDWQGFTSGSVMMLLLIGAGMAFTLIYFPKKMLEHANQAASVSLGMSAANRAGRKTGSSAKEQASKRVGQIGEAYKNWRNDDSNSSGSTAGSATADGGQSSSSTSGSDDTDGYERRHSNGDSGSRRGTVFRSKEQKRRRHAQNRRKRHKAHVDDLNGKDES